MSAQIVWFKRDLRIADHAPLARAMAAGPVLPVYVIEPDYWRQPDTAQRHWAFIRESLIELDTALAGYGLRLWVFEGEAAAIFRRLHETLGVAAIHAHEETGSDWTYRRDRAVRRICRQTGMAFHEVPQFGVVRPLASRDEWAGHWERRMKVSPVTLPSRGEALDPGPAVRAATHPVEALPTQLGVGDIPCPGRQPGGRAAGEALLESFLDARGETYRQGMSSPASAWRVCSRLSPHIAYGTLSLREIVQTHRRRWMALKAEAPRSNWAQSLKSFESRLHWHCHFIQKFEDEPALEYRNMHRGYDGLRDESGADPERLAAWIEGRTGLPFVDACMRQLRAEGWINFRMRAMLVAVSSYHLWMHWREPAQQLARLFTDYEPGIHYCQFQMQSGTTGINTLRIYNPVKQSRDQDADGAYIRHWVPELVAVSADWIHEPWRMPAGLQQRYGVRLGRDYPWPVVDHEQAAREAREKIKAHRASRDLTRESARVRRQHASRSPSPERPRQRRQRTVPGQGTLDL
ncbi:FAD-binding domain-containing protein [Spiribacter vilamensis]|uniref:Deoxyribodipyrimidine photo-lyase family protein (Cryptochrome) n=1 Tax=Spiribacter vilamensis TaxID=531306 RepID=A0A4Q8D1K9_9GAMM|nr:deoxyribodipyrimidine photo-lyase [Spiribacter vilamensis]RZU99147.1 deoxyribodipyrimidine photo-lyase family protein (cryptochrome) [Spiribacter vilamensis]TVO61859.1 deoxyribodipyrimidine photo-lyase [Spiribacter vilamensis]